MDPVKLVADLLDIAKRLKDVALQEKILEFREAVVALREENVGLKARNQELEARAAVQVEMSFDGRAYWKGKDGPFCPLCFDRNKKAIRLQHNGVDRHGGMSGTPGWRCNSCGNFYPEGVAGGASPGSL